MRASLEHVKKVTGKTPQELKPVPCPEELEYLIQLDWEATDGEPLTYQKLYYWDKVMGRGTKRWEYQALFLLDRVRWSLEK